MNTLEQLQQEAIALFEQESFLNEPSTLYDPIEYGMKQGGKRIRPLLTLIAADMFSSDVNKAKSAAIAVEILHNFTLLHDDIMDQSPLRRGKETVYKKFNSNKAILSGDTMFALAFKHLLNYENEIVKDLVGHLKKLIQKHVLLIVMHGQLYQHTQYMKQNNVYQNVLRIIHIS